MQVAEQENDNTLEFEDDTGGSRPEDYKALRGQGRPIVHAGVVHNMMMESAQH